MSMHRDHSKFIFECECCTETWEDYAEDSFDAMIARLKADGWRVVKAGPIWEHLCPKHKEK